MKKMAAFLYSSTTMTRKEHNYRCVRHNTACHGLSMYFEGELVDFRKDTVFSVNFPTDLELQKSFVLTV